MRTGANDLGGEQDPRQKYVMRYRYQIAKVFEIRQRLREELTHAYGGRVLTATKFQELLDLVLATIRVDIHRPVLEQSLVNLTSTHLTEALIDATSWRIAGNIPRLKQRRVVPVWHIQKYPEWVPVQIVACKRSRGDQNKLGATFTYRILAGTSASWLTLRWWSLRMSNYLAHFLGYTRPRGQTPARYPYTCPEQLVGLRLYALITPKLSEDSPCFERVAFSGTFTKYNTEVIKRRLRVAPGFRCIANRGRNEPCYQCPVGFTRCTAATHRQDWLQNLCPDCNKMAWFDPELNSPFCIACTQKRACAKPEE